MPKKWVIRVASYRHEGRLVPRRARGLRAAAVTLATREGIDWHSTRGREELLIALAGQVRVEIRSFPSLPRRLGRVTLKAGQCALLPRHTLHRVINRSAGKASYLYVTAPVR